MQTSGTSLPPHKQMDTIFGWVDGNGTAHAFDAMSDSKTQPKDDTLAGGTNDVFNVSGSEVNGFTTVSFSRKFVTNDSRDVPFVSGKVCLLCLFVIVANSRANANTHTNTHTHTHTHARACTNTIC